MVVSKSFKLNPLPDLPTLTEQRFQPSHLFCLGTEVFPHGKGKHVKYQSQESGSASKNPQVLSIQKHVRVKIKGKLRQKPMLTR